MSKILAVGDVHQKTWILDKVEKLIDNYDQVIFVGDYLDDFGALAVDRPAIINHLMRLKKTYGDKLTLLCGNHDLCYFDSKYAGLYGGYDYSSQAIINGDPVAKSFLRSLPQVVWVDGVAYSHAGLTDDWSEDRDPMDQDGHMWVRPEWGYVYRPKQVFGHTPSKTCYEVQKDVWCIDTFSTFRDRSPMGDHTVLEIIDGKEFNKIKL